MEEFPFTITDVAGILQLKIRHRNSISMDADCPFCGEHKGKLNLNIKKNVFKCNRCGESGGMLSLYGKVYNLNNHEACEEIKKTLGTGECKDDVGKAYGSGHAYNKAGILPA